VGISRIAGAARDAALAASSAKSDFLSSVSHEIRTPLGAILAMAEALLEVSDSGIGIPKEAQGRLCLPFSQADASISRDYGGTGLGLSICKRFVDLMGGSISVASVVGAGSVFAFTIPLEIPFPEEREEPRVPKRPLRLLLVEDYEPNRAIVKTFSRPRLTSSARRRTARSASRRSRLSCTTSY
jgi:signal transduction histidine kinase